MNEEQLKAISAVMDGELAEVPARDALDAVLREPALREQWQRYHVIGDVLRTTHVAGAGELASRVHAAVAREPAAPSRRPSRFAVARGPRVLALAASVAIIAVVVGLGLSGGDVPVPGGGTEARAGAASLAQDSHTLQAQAGTATSQAPASELTRLSWNDPRPQVEQRLNGYLLSHNEYLATGVRGLLPYARVVGYDARN